jgi:hypothetical protein
VFDRSMSGLAGEEVARKLLDEASVDGARE